MFSRCLFVSKTILNTFKFCESPNLIQEKIPKTDNHEIQYVCETHLEKWKKFRDS